METKEITELQRNNKTAMFTHCMSFLIMIAFIIWQAVTGSVTFTYAAAMFVVGIVPVVMEFLFWTKNRETAMVRHLTAIGVAIFYSLLLFTTSNSIVFVFVIPMVFVVSIYNDIKYLVLINVGTILESTLAVLFGASKGWFGFQGTDSAIVQIAVMIMVGVYSILTTKTLKDNSDQKIEHAIRAQEQAEHLLKTNARLSEKLSAGIADIHDKMEKLRVASRRTVNAMEELSSGASDTAESVQSQRLQTEAIQRKVDEVGGVSIQINESMQDTVKTLEAGSCDIASLVSEVDILVGESAAVTQKLETLNHYMEEMDTIVELIRGIATQTNLLALNASIEAARAGEAGRGFAVVATNISGMADRTRQATVSISELISNVSAALGEVVEVISQMVSSIDEEKQEASNAADSFGTIRNNAYAIGGHMEELVRHVSELKDANEMIVDSVQTISAISQEVAAHASTTMEAEEENAVVMGEIAKVMEDLVLLTEKSAK